MNDRRKFLTHLSTGTAGLLAATATGTAFASKKTTQTHEANPSKLHGRGQLPEVEVETSEGKHLRLYADLLKGNVVLVNYMSIVNEEAVPITAKLVEIVNKLDPTMRGNVHIVSITTDPGHDTPARLRVFAKRMGATEKGWHFVRMSTEGSMLVSARFHRHPMAPDPRSRIAVISYGNEPVGLWGLFPMRISPDDAVMRIASIFSGKPHSGALRRAGPRKLDAAGMPFNNRIA